MTTTSASETTAAETNSESRLARMGMALADLCERWFPDAFVFALVAIISVFFAGLLLRTPATELVRDFGEGFWSLIPFTMQMAMIIIGAYVVASSRPVCRLVQWLARIPRTPRGAVAFVAFFSMATALISWGLSLIFSGILVREVVKNVRAADYRAMGAAAYLGTGSVWALGFSSSAALMMATPASLPAALLKISGAIPLSQTIYTWQSMVVAGVLAVSAMTVAYLTAPASSSKTAESFGMAGGLDTVSVEKRTTPGEWLEHTPVLSVAIAALGIAYLSRVLITRGPLAALDLNTYNLLFLMMGLLLHWRPRSFVRAVNDAVPATAGVLIQFPFYGGIFGIVTLSAISRVMANFFIHVSSQGAYPILVTVYSAVLGMAVPSGGAKWVIEAPYVLQAAKDLHVNLGWVVQTYSAAEALPNLINPFWMLPLLGILKLRARDLVGYGLIQFMVNSALVCFLMWLLAKTFTYVPPQTP
jgi:short-chain fatty acids transporter